MFKAISKLLAIAVVGTSTVGCIGISKGNPLSLVPASELALIRSSAPKQGGRISVEDMLANARATDKEKAEPEAAPGHVELTWSGDAVEPEPGHLVRIGSFVAAAPQQAITIACGSSLDVVGLRAHRRALAVARLLSVMGIEARVKRDAELSPGTLKLVRGGRSA